MRRVIVMSGVSGSGKTVYAEKLIRGQGLSAIISTDDYFTDDKGYHFDPAKLGKAHADCFARFILVLQLGEAKLVVVDNTNTTVEEISPYMLGASAFQYEAELITILPRSSADIVKAQQRNVHSVPLGGITAQSARLFQRRLPKHWKSSTIDMQH